MNDLMRWDSYSLSSFAYCNDRASVHNCITHRSVNCPNDRFFVFVDHSRGTAQTTGGSFVRNIYRGEKPKKEHVLSIPIPFPLNALPNPDVIIVKLPIISILWSVYFHSIDNIIGESLPVTRSHTDWNHKTALFGWVAEVLPIDKFNSVATFGLLGFILITYLCTL